MNYFLSCMIFCCQSRPFPTEAKFLHKWLLTNKQVSKIRKAFPNGWSANIKFSKTQLYKMTQSGGILGELLVAIPQAILLAEKQAFKRLYHLHQN